MCVDHSDEGAIGVTEIVELFSSHNGSHHVEVFGDAQGVEVLKKLPRVLFATVNELLCRGLLGVQPLLASANTRNDAVEKRIELARIVRARDRRRLAHSPWVKTNDVVGGSQGFIHRIHHAIAHEGHTTSPRTARIDKQRTLRLATWRRVTHEG
ncbi:unannotated protein [freshwater metagenome]|uniref:Unannotated protein n=1 Tax=freshwater metagenome TaxID=449393 RepID=A0A6J6E7V9_9ZZZZ